MPDDQLSEENDSDEKGNECAKNNLKSDKITRGEVIGSTSGSGPAKKQEADTKSDSSDQNEEIEKQHGISNLLINRSIYPHDIYRIILYWYKYLCLTEIGKD